MPCFWVWKPSSASPHMAPSFHCVCSSPTYISDLAPTLHLHCHFASPPTSISPKTLHWSSFTYCLVSKASVDCQPPGRAHCPPRPCFCLQFHRDYAPLLSLQLALTSTRLFLPQSLGICYFQPHRKLLVPNCPHWFSLPPNLSLNMITVGTSLVVQWLRFRASSAGGPGLISGQRTRS